MTNLFAWLISAVGPLVIRVVAALTMAQQSWTAIPVAVLQLCTLSGIPQVLGMIFGAYMARVAMWAAVGAARYVLKT